jgi:hypothetical protein
MVKKAKRATGKKGRKTGNSATADETAPISAASANDETQPFRFLDVHKLHLTAGLGPETSLSSRRTCANAIPAASRDLPTDIRVFHIPPPQAASP